MTTHSKNRRARGCVPGPGPGAPWKAWFPEGILLLLTPLLACQGGWGLGRAPSPLLLTSLAPGASLTLYSAPLPVLCP